MDFSATKDCHCLAARRRAREITRLYEEKLRPHGLRATQFSVLAALALKGPTPSGNSPTFWVWSARRSPGALIASGTRGGSPTPSRRTPGNAAYG
ncbi:hypothetical protein ACFFQF_18180 [Haladaptatus pallidirubidus]|uniref:hypothetical protein n=1 Tax=Haladaptatus pallidirubidus TaxID=1008152 RepID=UPI0035E8428F